MRILLMVVVLAASLVACKSGKNIPDVSNIPVSLKVERFEKDFFGADTNHLSEQLDKLNEKYPFFLKDYLYNIQGWEPKPDSVLKYYNVFIHDKMYKALADSVNKAFSSIDDVEKDLKKSFQFVHYYFPKYKLPEKLITFIGPMEGTGNALTNEGLAVGLQAYLGRDFSAYQTQYISQVYPFYQSRRFERSYIVVNAINNIVEDIFSGKKTGSSLIEQMVLLGKKLYVTDKLLPETADSLKIGYTTEQLQGCFANEKKIWSFFIENNLLFEKESNLIGTYINDGPSTPEISSASPGFIGKFVGWQIVKKWMNQHENKKLEDLIKTPSLEIFNETKYKP